MKPYQEEYIKNIRDINALTARRDPAGCSIEEYREKLLLVREWTQQVVRRNMLLLREELFPVLDHLFEAGEEELSELEEFAGKLSNTREDLDVELFCQIHQALLNRARHFRDRNTMIKELYWLGMGHNKICNMLSCMDLSDVDTYMFRMRLCFTEAAAYLKYFDEIEDTETKGYILRSRANMSLGKFRFNSEKIDLVRQTLEILQDLWYQEKAPGLPWDRFTYMTHRQMVSSISYSKQSAMTSRDIESIMESVYIVYDRQFQEAAAENKQPAPRYRFAYDAIHFYCGLDTLNGLLEKMEDMMDEADPEDFSTDGMYSLISLPAFYCNFLQEYPEKIPERREYVDSLYRKIFCYMEEFPQKEEAESLFFYLRQLLSAYVETESSVPYGEFVLKLMLRFVPEVYAHSYIVGKTAQVFCEMIMEEEPSFFDDIECIREIEDPGQKREAVTDYARRAGLYHDVGKINFIDLYSHTSRQWFEEEYEMAHLHTTSGCNCLENRASTRKFAVIALGHHSWYDGSRGYPDSYKRLECAERQMVDVIGLMDWLDNVTYTAKLYTGVEKTFDQAVEEAIEMEGKRFSPVLTVWLRDNKVKERLKDAVLQGRREVFLKYIR